METFVRTVMIAVVPMLQFAMVVWRVQGKVKVSIGWTALYCLFLSFMMANWAATIFPETLAHCIGCEGSAGKTSALSVFIIALFTNWLFSLIVSLLALNEYRARHSSR